MSITNLIHVRPDGSVKLGNKVACDGGIIPTEDFHIVTHAHKDHYKEPKILETWREYNKKIYLTNLTMHLVDIYGLSVVDSHGKRKVLEFNEPLVDGDVSIKLIENGHILGSAQVEVVENNVGRFGYSGDFCSQAEETINVDYLVLDATYSGKTQNKTWTEEKCIEELVERVKEAQQKGPVNILAVPGLLQEVLFHIGEKGFWDQVPTVLGDKITKHWSKIYNQEGLAQPNILIKGTEEAREESSKPNRISISHKRNPRIIPKGTTFKISHFGAQNIDPIVQSADNENLYTVALTSHATGDDVMNYVERVDPRLVITDAVRNPSSAVTLKENIESRLNIDVMTSAEINL